MVAFERGFKAWADRTSTSVRAELGLDPDSPLDPRKLAAYLDVSLLGPANVKGLSQQALSQLLKSGSDDWSAVTCTVGEKLIVVYNTSHAPTRQSTDIMHELAHVLLGHKAGRLILSQNGQVVMRTYDQQEESEADWLAGALLLPREALLQSVRKNAPHEETCRAYVVSQRLLTWRLHATGVLIQAARMKRRAPTKLK